MTLVYNLPLNSEVLIQHKSNKQTRPYRLLAVENETCYIQLPSGLTSFRSTSIKPYFWPKDNHNIKPDKLETIIKLDKLEATIKPDELEATIKPDEPEATTKPDKLGAPLPTLEAPQEPTKPTKPTVKHS